MREDSATSTARLPASIYNTPKTSKTLACARPHLEHVANEGKGAGGGDGHGWLGAHGLATIQGAALGARWPLPLLAARLGAQLVIGTKVVPQIRHTQRHSAHARALERGWMCRAVQQAAPLAPGLRGLMSSGVKLESCPTTR